MRKKYVKGNDAIALGALAAGINMAAGYPDTLSSEIIEIISRHNNGGIHIEWSANKKNVMELAVSASCSDARALVAMKYTDLNEKAELLTSLAYMGVKGGLVVAAIDEPDPQLENNAVEITEFAGLPIFYPTSPEEAYKMIQDAFDYSEKYHTPVLFRPSSRIYHAYTSITIPDSFSPKDYNGFINDTSKWIIFPPPSDKNPAKS